jgi:hypothetical protein
VLHSFSVLVPTKKEGRVHSKSIHASSMYFERAFKSAQFMIIDMTEQQEKREVPLRRYG